MVTHTIRKSFEVVGKDGSTELYLSTLRYASIFAQKYGVLVRYAFLVMVRVR